MPRLSRGDPAVRLFVVEAHLPENPYDPGWRRRERDQAVARVGRYAETLLALRGADTRTPFSGLGYCEDLRAVRLESSTAALTVDRTSHDPTWACQRWVESCEEAAARSIGQLLALAAPRLLDLLGHP